MLVFYFIFVGLLAATTDAFRNYTITKDKRQVNQHNRIEANRNFIPATHQSQISAHQHYSPSNDQIGAQISPDYYNYVQKLLKNQQQQQTSDSSQENVAEKQNHHHNPAAEKQTQFVYYNQPQTHYGREEVDSQSHLHPKTISEEEYQELIQRQNSESVNNTATSKYPINSGRHYKIQQKDYQQIYAANDHPQSYLKTYVNPLGEFSLEKELAQLEKSNKATYNHNGEADSQQSLKKENYDFKPSHQFVSYQNQQASQQDQFIPSEYSQYSGPSAHPQKLIHSEYEREENAPEKLNDRPEYRIQYATPTESSVKYYSEPVQTRPKNAFVQLPRHQYLSEVDSASYSSDKSNPEGKVIQSPYQKQHQYPRPQPQSALQPIQKNTPNKQQPTVTLKAATKFHEKLPQPQSSVHAAPSHSSIFVSQGTGIQQKQQEISQESTQQLYPHNHQQQREQPQQSQPQQHHLHQHYPQQIPNLPPNRPLTQQEFQALVDAGYKVQAIPIPVPVPVSREEYAQHHQQQLQHPKQQQPQQPVPVPVSREEYAQHHQQKLQQHPKQQQVQQTQQHRPQPSNKHFVRYQQQQPEGILTSYLRPFLDQYSNLMEGKI